MPLLLCNPQAASTPTKSLQKLEEHLMTLVQELEKPVNGYWEGGPRKIFRWSIDGQPKGDKKGFFVRVGSWEANHWFNVSVGKTEKVTMGNARRRLSYYMRLVRVKGTFRYEGG